LLTQRRYDKTKDREVSKVEPMIVVLAIIITAVILGSLSIRGAGRGATFDNSDRFGRERR
jgi:hypothetical protein